MRSTLNHIVRKVDMCLLDERYVKFTKSDMEVESVAIKSDINPSDCDPSWEEWE